MDELVCGFAVPFEYRVVFTEGLFRAGNPVLTGVVGDGRAAVLVERAVAESSPGLLREIETSGLNLATAPVVMQGGEAAKRDTRVFDDCVRLLHDLHLDRHAYVIIVGGGAFLDAAGFAASVVHRGIRQVRVPTTVLAQNDAGIGVKNGIDAMGKKNFLGTFSPPWAVINDYAFLRTLPDGVFRDGSAEAVKVGLIRDGAFFEWVEANAARLRAREETTTRWMIRRCAELHLAQIAKGGDPFERGSARPLDFGHWAAHKMEALSGFRMSHGAAVATGMVLDTEYAERVGIAGTGTARRVRECLEALGFEIGAMRFSPTELLAGLEEFREHLGGTLSITMLETIGRAREVETINLAAMRECLIAVCGTPGGERSEVPVIAGRQRGGKAE